MTAALRSELLKLRTTRTFVGIVAAALVLVGLIGGAMAAAAPFDDVESPGRDLIDVAGLLQPFALVVGILAVSTEFRHGTITPTILAVPNRVRLMGAKLLAHVLAGTALAVPAYALATALVVVVLPVRDVTAGLTAGEAVEMLAGGIVAVALLAALGVGFGALVRNQVGAVMAGLGWMFVVEPLLTAIPTVGPAIDDYGLNGAITAVTSSAFGGGTDVSALVGGLLLLLYTALLAIAGVWTLRRRDIG